MQAMWKTQIAKQPLHASHTRRCRCIRDFLAVSLLVETAAGKTHAWLMRRVLLTPHVAGVTELSYKRMAQIVATEARRMRSGLPPSILLNNITVQ